MLSPFENIIIGNFLFGLGLVMGNKPRQVDACVNLLQQTPLDKVLGDVMLQFPGSWRLIEFKRRGANLKKEKVKLATYRGATSRDRELRAASMRAHPQQVVNVAAHPIELDDLWDRLDGPAEVLEPVVRVALRSDADEHRHGGVDLVGVPPPRRHHVRPP